MLDSIRRGLIKGAVFEDCSHNPTKPPRPDHFSESFSFMFMSIRTCHLSSNLLYFDEASYNIWSIQGYHYSVKEEDFFH